jgi:hypothetical protein
MKMPGDLDDVYVRARSVLLDALEALAEHREAIILVGAQAVYLHTGEGDLAVAHYTTDGDLAIDPGILKDTPLLREALQSAGFNQQQLSQSGDVTVQVGIWASQYGVTVDLLVPDAVGGGGRRGARLPVHGNDVARKARGLEGALIDHEMLLLTALDPRDTRMLPVKVAGPAALLVAKLHKVSDMVKDRPTALEDKDALDVLRLLQDVPAETLRAGLNRLIGTAEHDIALTARETLGYLRELFGLNDSRGSLMAARAVGILADPETVAASCAALTQELLEAIHASDP